MNSGVIWYIDKVVHNSSFHMTFRLLSVSDDLTQTGMYWCSILIDNKGQLWQVIKCRGSTKRLLVFPDVLYLVSLSCWRWLSCLLPHWKKRTANVYCIMLVRNNMAVTIHIQHFTYTEIKVKEQLCYCCSIFHSHHSVFIWIDLNRIGVVMVSVLITSSI